MSSHRSGCPAVALALAGLACFAGASRARAAGIARVWAVNDGEKVKRDDLANPNAAGNSTWDGRRISIFGARNEIVAFQVIVQAGAEGAKGVDVVLAELVHTGGKKLVPLPARPDPADYRGGHIERFTQHYLHITKPSPPGWFYNRAAKPKDMTGWFPDPLVPPQAKPGRGGCPFNIGASQNQGVWFDVYIPKEAPAGTWEGEVAVIEGGKAHKKLPVTLRVFDFVLPDENHFNSMICFGEWDVRRRHPGDVPGIIAGYHRLAHRHRVEFVSAYGPNSNRAKLDLISGAAFTPERGYIGPGMGVGYEVVPASFYGINNSWQGAQAHRTADAFMTWLKQVKPKAVTFLYIVDEPPRGRFAWIKSIGDLHHSNPGPGKDLPMFVTKSPQPELDGAIDIWCTVSNRVDIEKVKAENAKGRRWWYYNGHRPYVGTNITDAPAVDCRVGMWASWKYGVELWFYWHANHWKHNHFAAQRGDQNIWVDPIVFAGSGGINGDGLVVYPGEDTKHPDQDRGVKGPVASIRLKNIRRGMQDYEYLWLAAENGLEAQARAVADACVPRAFSEASGDVSWSIRGSDWDTQRLMLARLLEQKLGKKPSAARRSRPKDGRPAPPGGPTEKEIAAAKAAEAKLRAAVIKGAGAGKTARVYIDMMGRPTRATLLGADDSGIKVKASGMETTVKWSSLRPGRFYGVARRYSDDHKLLAAYCRGNGLAEEAAKESGLR